MQPGSRIPPATPSISEAGAMLRVAIGLLLDPRSDADDITLGRTVISRLYFDGYAANPEVLRLAGVSADQVKTELTKLGVK